MTMDPKNPLIHVFQKPTIENVTILERYINKDVKDICASGKDKLIITAIFTMIAEMPDLRNKNEMINRLIKLVILLISNSRVSTLMSMQTMLIILLKTIGVGPAFMSIQTTLSEELKLAIMNCFEVIFRRATPEVIRKFYTKDSLNILAQVLSISANILIEENYRILRISAVKCMMSVFQVHDESDDNDDGQRKYVANITFLLIPKIMSSLTNVATSGGSVGDNLIKCSITAIYRILHLIFEDYTDKANMKLNLTDLMKRPLNSPKAIMSSKSAQTVDDRLNELKSKERSEGWLSIASSKLCPIIQRLKRLTSSNSTQIRKELFKLSDVLLCECQRNMAECIPALLEINVCLNDENQLHYSTYNEHVIDVAEESFAALLINLPRIIHTGDEDEQIVGFLQLKGLVRLLHETNRLKITLSNDNIAEKFITVLLLAVEMERDNKLLEINSHIYDLTETKGLVRSDDITPWKNYKNLRNSKLIQEIRSTCKCVSEQMQTYTFILEFLFKLLAKNSVNCNEALVLIQIFLGSSSNESDTTESLHSSILENLIFDYRWQLQTHVVEGSDDDEINKGVWFEDRVDGLYESAFSIRFSDIPSQNVESKFESVTLKEVKNNILHICLVIETVGCYAKKMQHRYQIFLMRCLPRLIEKSSSSHQLIRVSALSALESLKIAFNLSSTSDLIFTNADYITQSINTSLKKPNQMNDALRILNTATYYNSIESIPHLEGVVLNMIAESTKLNQSKNMLSFMNAFKCILSNIREHNLKWKNELSSSEIMNSTTPVKTNHYEEWLNVLKAEPNIEEENIDNDVEIDPNYENNIETEMETESDNQKTSDLPYIQLTLNIIKHCIPHIASNNVDVKLMALECLTIGLDLIKDVENEFLPIVHLVWDPFMQQYKRNKSPVLLRYCFQFLVQVAQHAKEFISKRSSSQLLPNINQYLCQLSKKYTTEHRSTFYEHCQEVKMLKEILIGLPILLKSLNVQERDLYDVLNAVSWLLNKKKPSFIDQICENFIRELESFDICSLYVKLVDF